MPDEREPSGDSSPFSEFEQEPLRGRTDAQSGQPARSSPSSANRAPLALMATVVLVGVATVGVVAGGGGGVDDEEAGGGGASDSAARVATLKGTHRDCVSHAREASRLCRVLLGREGPRARATFARCLSREQLVKQCIAQTECIVELGRAPCRSVLTARTAAEAYMSCRLEDSRSPKACARRVG